MIDDQCIFLIDPSILLLRFLPWSPWQQEINLTRCSCLHYATSCLAYISSHYCLSSYHLKYENKNLMFPICVKNQPKRTKTVKFIWTWNIEVLAMLYPIKTTCCADIKLEVWQLNKQENPNWGPKHFKLYLHQVNLFFVHW